jgi:hypothetical protein
VPFSAQATIFDAATVVQMIFCGREHCPAKHDPQECPICSWAAVPPYNKYAHVNDGCADPINIDATVRAIHCSLLYRLAIHTFPASSTCCVLLFTLYQVCAGFNMHAGGLAI